MHSTVSCKPLHVISVEALLENTVLETVNGSHLFSFTDTPTTPPKKFIQVIHGLAKHHRQKTAK
jgi:hypothetical protein